MIKKTKLLLGALFCLTIGGILFIIYGEELNYGDKGLTFNTHKKSDFAIKTHKKEDIADHMEGMHNYVNNATFYGMISENKRFSIHAESADKTQNILLLNKVVSNIDINANKVLQIDLESAEFEINEKVLNTDQPILVTIIDAKNKTQNISNLKNQYKIITKKIVVNYPREEIFSNNQITLMNDKIKVQADKGVFNMKGQYIKLSGKVKLEIK